MFSLLKSAASGLRSRAARRMGTGDIGSRVARAGRFLYGLSLSWIGFSWYMAWRNERVQDDKTSWPVPGVSKLPARFDPDRSNPQVPADTIGGDVGGAAGSVGAAAGAATLGTGNLSHDPKVAIVQIGHLAQQRYHLHVGENPSFGGVHPVHAPNSLHYSGRAIDVSGAADVMRQFAEYVQTHYGARLAELIHNPGFSIKNGKRVPTSFWGAATWAGHRNHVHVGI